MDVVRRLLDLANALPEGGAVTLDADALRRLAGVEVAEEAAPTDEPVADLTCADVAAELDRSASTVRSWCAGGEVPGAYRLNGREWRIPRASLRRYLDGQAEAEDRAEREGRPVDLGSWRQHYAAGSG